MRLNKSNIEINRNKLKKIAQILFFWGVFQLSQNGFSQSIQFSQYYSSPMNLGPSFAGMVDGGRAVMNYRDQWPKIPGTFVTYAFSYDQYFSRMNSGLGFLIVRDQAGSGNLSLTDYGIVYSYDLAIDRIWHFRPGVQFKFSQRGIDFAKLVFGDQLSLAGATGQAPTIEVPPRTKNEYLDITSSALLYSAKYWIGFTIDHLLEPNQSLRGDQAKVPMKFSTYGGMRIPLSSKNRRRMFDREVENLTFSFYYRRQAGLDQLDLGAYWNKDPFVVGLWFRGMPVIRKSEQTGAKEKLDAVILLLGYKIFNLRFGYSYDFTVSKLMSSTGGSHEISLTYEFDVKLASKRKRAIISCPKF